MPKGQGDLTPQQMAFAKGLTEKKTITQAARDAGYKHPHVQGSRVLASVRKNKNFMMILDKAGLAYRHILKPLKDGLTATKTATFEGAVLPSDQPDHSERIKAAEVALKLRGHLQKGEEDKGGDYIDKQLIIKIGKDVM